MRLIVCPAGASVTMITQRVVIVIKIFDFKSMPAGFEILISDHACLYNRLRRNS